MQRTMRLTRETVRPRRFRPAGCGERSAQWVVGSKALAFCLLAKTGEFESFEYGISGSPPGSQHR